MCVSGARGGKRRYRELRGGAQVWQQAHACVGDRARNSLSSGLATKPGCLLIVTFLQWTPWVYRNRQKKRKGMRQGDDALEGAVWRKNKANPLLPLPFLTLFGSARCLSLFISVCEIISFAIPEGQFLEAIHGPCYESTVIMSKLTKTRKERLHENRFCKRFRAASWKDM